MTETRLRHLRVILGSVALLGVAAALAGELPRALRDAAPVWLGVAVCLRALSALAGALRWWHILRGLHAAPLSRRRALAFSLEALWLSLGLPTSVGGDAWRVYRVRSHLPIPAGVAAGVLDRGLGAAALLAIAAIAALAQESISVLAGTAALLVGACALALLLLAVPRVRAALRALLATRAPLRGRASDWAAAAALAAVASLALIASHVAVAAAIDLRVEPAVLVWVVPWILIARMLPLAPAGLGTGEGAAALLLADAVEPDRAVAFAFLGLAAVLPTALLGGLLLLGRQRCGATA